MLRLGRLLVVVLALSLATACAASAATRYAAPGGTGADPCTDPADPCSIYTAADNGAPGTTLEAGDTVEVTPGTYSEADGDLGPSHVVQPAPGVLVRGEPGAPKPLIVLETDTGSWGAFFVGPATEVLDLEIRNQAANGSAITVQGGAIDRVIARSTVSTAFTCTSSEGTIRSSACINSAGGTAIGVSVLTSSGVHATVIRNSTFIASGPGSVGMDFAYFASSAGVVGAVSGIGVIAKGEAKDVVADGLEYNGSGHGAATAIELQASDYATTDEKTSGSGTAVVTPAGTDGNITAPPLLAADNIHQLPASPTIDKGAVDGSSSSFDVDGQDREIGMAPDIGADELGNPTTTTISCPATTVFSSPSSETVFCTARITDVSPAPTAPTGTVTFFTEGAIISGFCTLSAVSASASSCQMSYSSGPGNLGPHPVTATYRGDAGHEPSAGNTTITVIEKSSAAAGSGSADLGGSGASSEVRRLPDTDLRKHPAARTTKRKSKFTFSSSDPGSGFECKLDRKPFKPCLSPFVRTVKPGPHKFQVRAVDPQGKRDPTPVIFRWRLLVP